MRALITGGAGFIGSHLSEYLLSRGYTVTALDDLSTGTKENIAHLMHHDGFDFINGTILDPHLVNKQVNRHDIIFHLAAAVGVDLVLASPVHTIETNVIGTETVIKAVAHYRKKLLIASTSEVYGKGTRVPFSEGDDRLLGPTTKSRWSYAASKAMDEYLAQAYYHEQNIPIVIFRLFNTVGPRQTGRYGMVIPRFVQQALAGDPLTVYGSGNQSRCFCDVSDVVKAITSLVDTPAAEGQVFNIGNPQEVTITELAERVIALAGSSSPIRYIPYEQAYSSGFEDMMRRVPNITKIQQTIGWQPTLSLNDILARVIDYYRN